MAQAAFEVPQGNPVVRWAAIGLGVLLAFALGWFIYQQLTGISAVNRKPDTSITAAPDLLPPPPPPPPPPPKPVEKPPEPTDVPKPSPEQAAPKNDAPKAMTMDAPAEAGAGGIASGSGNGMGQPGSAGGCLKPPCGGGGFSDALYRGNLARDLQDRILDNEKVNRLAFKAVFAISVNSAGQVTRADLLTSTGDTKRDQILLAILRSARGLEAPPAQVRFPQRVTVTGRRSF